MLKLLFKRESGTEIMQIAVRVAGSKLELQQENASVLD
jgi:hypothetical protein